MDEWEETACHFDNLRGMLAIMKKAAVRRFVKEVKKLHDEGLNEIERVSDIKLSGLNGLEELILGKGHVIDPQSFFRSAIMRSLLTFWYEPSSAFTSACFGSVVACEATADKLMFVEDYHMKMYEEGSRIVIYYMCESEHDPLLIKFIKVSVRDEGGENVNVSNHDLMNGVYMITFAANVPGTYEICVALSNQNITGSPFNILVQGGESTVPKASLMMNELGLGDPHMRYGRLAVNVINPTSTSIVASFDKPTQALTKGCSVPSGCSKKHREHISMPETDIHGKKANCNSTFLRSMLQLIAQPKQLSEPPSCAESVTKAAACNALAEHDSGAACPQTSAPKHGNFNIQIDSCAGHALTTAAKHGSLNVKTGEGAAQLQKSAPRHDTWNVEVDSYAATAQVPASKHNDLSVKVDNGAAQPNTSLVKCSNMDIRRSTGKELVHSDSVRLDGLKSLELSSMHAATSVENMPAGSAKQGCRPADMPTTADGARSTDVPPRPACVVKPVGSILSRSRSSSCTAPSVIASRTSARADRPGSISGRVVLELDSYKNRKFSYPIGITATSQGSIIVCDTGNDRVVAFDPEGRPLHEANFCGSKEAFCRPSAVVAMEDGKYAVKDDCCIYVFSRHGQFIHTLGKGSLRRPYGLALCGKENLLTLSLGESVPTLRCFSASGNFERCVLYGPLARGVPAGSKCRFMDVHKDAVFVADLGLSRVYKTDMKGQVISTFGTKGKERGHMLEPSGVSGTEHLLFIGDSKNNRIQAFDSEGNFIAVVKMASGLVRPSGVYVSPTDQLCVLNYLQGVAGIYRLTYLDSDS